MLAAHQLSSKGSLLFRSKQCQQRHKQRVCSSAAATADRGRTQQVTHLEQNHVGETLQLHVVSQDWLHMRQPQSLNQHSLQLAQQQHSSLQPGHQQASSPRQHRHQRQQESYKHTSQPGHRTPQQRASFRAVLQRYQTWEQLAAYLCSGQLEQRNKKHNQPNHSGNAEPQQQRHPVRVAQQGQSVEQQPWWQTFSSHQAREVLQHATGLASKQRRGKQHQQHPQEAAHPQAVAGGQQADPPDQLQDVFVALVSKAAAGVAPGDAAAAGQVLRASWKLQNHKQQQHAKQYNQHLLELMCAGHCQHPRSSAVQATSVGAADGQVTAPAIAALSAASPATVAETAAAGGAPALQNANLLADISAAVLQLQLTPSHQWVSWYRDTSLSMLQMQQSRPAAVQEQQQGQLQQGLQTSAAGVNSWFLVNALQLAQYLSSVQQQQQSQPGQNVTPRPFPDAAWTQAWTAAALRQAKPFKPQQLLLVTAAALQLGMQLPDSFYSWHLQAAELARMPCEVLLRLLPNLAKLQKQRQQEQEVQGQLPAGWLQAAAEALPAAAAAAVSSSDTSVCRLIPGAVSAASRLQLPVNQAGLEQLLALLLQQQQTQHCSSGSAAASDTGPDSSTDTQHAAVTGHCRNCALLLVSPYETCSAVVALAKLSKHQPPLELLKQLQQQLRPLLPKAGTSPIIAAFWALAVTWEAPINKPFMSMLLGVLEHRLKRCSANKLRLLGTAVAAAAGSTFRIPTAWTNKYLQSTAAVLAQKQASLDSSNSSRLNRETCLQQAARPQQLMWPASEAAEHAAFVSNVACCLAKMQITPDLQWQAVWRRQAVSLLGVMTPDQTVDVLYAAAVWAGDLPASAVPATAASAAQTSSRQPQVPLAARAANQPDVPHVPAAAQLPVQSSHSTVGGAQQLLPRPVLSAPSTAATPATTSVTRAATINGSSYPPQVWVNAVLLQLHRQLPQCTPKQLTTMLWCLNKLGFKAAVPWLDAVYDRLLVQLAQTSLLQLQILLRGLLYQGLQLAPARIDMVLQAALQRLQEALPNRATVSRQPIDSLALLSSNSRRTVSSRRGSVCVEQQLVWLLRLIVKLQHDPEPEWGRAVARTAQQMLHSSCRLNSDPAWDAALLTGLIDGLAQLGVQLPPKWLSCYRKALWRVGSRNFTGLQLARVLSALAALHCSAVARPFLQRILSQLGRQLPIMDPHALGLAGVAVGQLGFVPARGWIILYLQRVQHLVQSRVKVSVSDAGNLQRSVQYMMWCSTLSRARGSAGTLSRFRAATRQQSKRYRRQLPGTGKARKQASGPQHRLKSVGYTKGRGMTRGQVFANRRASMYAR